LPAHFNDTADTGYELKAKFMVNSYLDEDIVSRFSDDQVVTYFNMYLKNASLIIENLKDDFQTKDIESIKARSHKLKGSSMVVGAVRIKELSAEIENDAREKNKADNEKFELLKEQFNQLAYLLKIRYNISLEH